MLTHWLSGLHITLSWSKKNQGEIYSKGILHSEYFDLGEPLCRHYIDCCFVSGHSDITSFRPWSPIPTGNFWSHLEISKIFSEDYTLWRLSSAFRHSGTHFAENFRMSKCLWMMDPTRSRAMPRFTASDVAEFRRSSKISLWMWSVIYGVVTVLGRPGQDATRIEKLARLNWTTHLLTAE